MAAQEDDNDYVDVALKLEALTESVSGRELYIIVVNHGSRTAYDVEVVVDVVYPENSSFFSSVKDVSIGSASVGSGGYSIHWTIPALGGLQRAQVLGDMIDKHSIRDFDKSEYVHEFVGEVTTSSFERSLHRENNEDRAWSVAVNPGDFDNEPAWSTYSVTVSVDKQNPSPGDIVNFTITANHGGRIAVIDQEVDIELTNGLAVDEDSSATPPREISYTPDDRADSVSYSNGVFNIGTLTFSDYNLSHSVTLPVRVSSTAVVNEQCLTATITGNPPPGTGAHDDDISDNVAILCLGSHAPPYFTSGDVQEFVSHPCVGNSTFPCDNTDDVRVRAIDVTIDPPAILDPGTPLIHVPDTSKTRMYDDDTNSVNGENIVSWQVPVQVSYRQYTDEHERWTDVADSFSYEMTSKVDNFDKLHIRVSWAQALMNDGQRQDTFLATYDPGATAASNGPFDLTAEFENLGTYKVQYSITATHDNNTDMDTTDDEEYSATGFYIFHVGPIGDLEVRDGGASLHAAADQDALTIVAANNYPSYEGHAHVTGLPTGAEVLHINQGSYDSAAGEWNIGELRGRDYYRSRGEPDRTLALSASDGDTADVNISSANYEV
ncbi:MAG: hypothetical protein OXI91_10190 [Chloroflexota bacterium]|nr:hypothetical protein [Chloroflexota bacterium]